MKPIPAIVEPAQIDVDLLAKRIVVAIAEERQADTSAARHEQQAAAARETAKVRRVEIGQMLLKARGAWPQSGPRAKGWGEFLAKVKLDDSTAWRYMDDVRNPKRTGDSSQSPDVRGNSTSLPGPAPANVNGGSGDPARGSYCTPAKYAAAVGSWDLDPFSNPRSHIVADIRCMLENGGDGLVDRAQPGRCRWGGDQPGNSVAASDWRVWIQPPYSIVEEAIAHYGHTRFCALLRFDPSTEWFASLWKLTKVVAIPFGERLEFEGPPDIETSANPYPHAFYYSDERDVTPAIRELCIVLRVEHQTWHP